jgi:hypothetical protein
VEQASAAESLPELYRRVLDRVADLEQQGHRVEGGNMRAEAIRIYSAAWTDGAARRLRKMSQRADRILKGPRPRAPKAPRPPRRLTHALARLNLDRPL